MEALLKYKLNASPHCGLEILQFACLPFSLEVVKLTLSVGIFDYQTLYYFKLVLLSSQLAGYGLVEVILIKDSLHPALIEAWNDSEELLLVDSSYDRK